MLDRLDAMEALVESIVTRLEALEAAARRKVAKSEDEQAVDQIIATAWNH